ncbi:MAG: L,D-transpeptidase family protein [Christensenellales bacterium]|jgi:peptidoglycan hydrolase-like protein with peptidoglycan-binding domain
MKKIFPILLCALVFFAAALYPRHEATPSDIASAAIQGSAETVEEPMPVATNKPVPRPTPVPTPEPPPIVKGASSQEVTILQEKLLQWGFAMEKADGIYGKNTVDAVMRLQTYLNIADHSASLDWGDISSGVQTLSATDVESADAATLEYPVNGEVYAKMRKFLFDGEAFPYYQYTVTENDENDQVLRVQYRLTYLGYLHNGADGQFGRKTLQGLKLFQETNGLEATGVADEPTQKALFSENALAATRPVHEYKIVVDVSDQRTYVYMWNDGEYNTLIQTFKCSTGVRTDPTPLGIYSVNTGPASRWHYFKKFNCWAQYAWAIEGDILFHSVLYDKQDVSTIRRGSVYSLGHRASHGCIRLSVADAKWLFENCIAGTTVVIKN